MSDNQETAQRSRMTKEYFDPSNEGPSSSRKWTKADAEVLLPIVEKYGDRDVFLLSSKMGYKTPSIIHKFLMKQKATAAKEVGPIRNESQRFEYLEKWIESMKQTKQKTPLPVPGAVAMLMIALLEDHPVPIDDEVNFPEAYNYLYELLSGRHSLRAQNSLSAPTKRFIRLTVLSLMKEVFSNIGGIVDRFVQVPRYLNTGRKTDDNLKHLLYTPHNNPLNVSSEAIAPMALDNWKDDDSP